MSNYYKTPWESMRNFLLKWASPSLLLNLPKKKLLYWQLSFENHYNIKKIIYLLTVQLSPTILVRLIKSYKHQPIAHVFYDDGVRVISTLIIIIIIII